MNHYFGAMDIAKTMGDAMGGKGKVAILNAPPGIIIRDQRTNGFVEGMKAHHPDIEIVADQVADWDRKKAQDVLNTILAANPDLGGVYGVNDSMADGSQPYRIITEPAASADPGYAGMNAANVDVIRAWLHSPTHRRVMLNHVYRRMGVASVPYGRHGERATVVQFITH